MDYMESRESDSDSNSIDISHALEHEQIEGLKRVLCDSQSRNNDDHDEDDVDVTAPPEEKRLKRSHTTDSSNSAGRSIVSFFNRDDHVAGTGSRITSTGTAMSEKCSTNSSKSNEKQNARNYSKYRAVCLICAKNDNPKLQKRASLSRSGDYQIKRHKTSCHPNIPVAEVKRNIVPFNHASVPKSLREKKPQEKPASSTISCNSVKATEQPEPHSQPDETTVRDHSSVAGQPEPGNDDHDSNSEQVEVHHSDHCQNASYSGSNNIGSPAKTRPSKEYSGNGPSGGNKLTLSANNTLQTDLSNFVTIEKQTFEEKVLSMLERLSNKVDNLKEAKSNPIGDTY